jgi:ABC-2 type transport system permease protein
MKWYRVKAVALRHIYPLRRDFDLLSDMVYWPMIDTLLWGITGRWLADASGESSILLSILMALLMWNAIWRSQAEVSRNLIDEIWNNNLVNLFTTPLALKEWLVSIGLLSFLKAAVTLVLVTIVIWLMHSISIFFFGWWLVMFLAAMIMTGWWVGFISSGIVMRYGPKMQTVVWTLPGMLLPFSAVFFPLERFPEILQVISLAIPTTYVFEAMRSIAAGGTVHWDQLVLSFGLNALYLILSLWYFTSSFKKSVSLGLGRFN